MTMTWQQRWQQLYDDYDDDDDDDDNLTKTTWRQQLDDNNDNDYLTTWQRWQQQQRLVDSYNDYDNLTMAVATVLDFTEEEWESMKMLTGKETERIGGALIRMEQYNCRSYKSNTLLTVNYII